MSEQNELDETIKEFLVEAQENMEDAYKCLDALEANPEDLEPIRSLFRSIHSIKGAAGFFNFSTLEGVGHFCESILSKLRDGKFSMTPERQVLIYEAADAIDKTIASLIETGKEGEEEYIELIMRLRDDSQSEGESASGSAAEKNSVEDKSAENQGAGSAPSEEVEVSAEAEDTTLEEGEDAVSDETPEVAEEIVSTEANEESIAGEKSDKSSPSPQQAQASSPDVAGKAAPSEATTPSSGISESSIRVNVSLLDKLMNLVEELVLSRNQILRHTAGIDNNDLTNASQVFSLVTSELQEGIMKTRMQPVNNVFSKFPRIVRDIARSCEKDITFKTEGEETELDRTIIEAIKDPLTHIVRNSVDHGIEKTAERVAAGKPESGTLLIRAFHEGGQVVIEIIDDGAGISTDRVRNKALERGIITQAQAGEMTDDEINNLIMLPGFSTVEVVTNLSGRGVGMDVVKTNIEKIGGTVDLKSVEGEGTTLRISIPLTLAIVPALIVTAEGERFAIPQVNLQELVRLDEEEMGNQIERVSGAETYRLRGDLLPLLRLSDVLRLEKKSWTEEIVPVDGGETHEEAGAAEEDMAPAGEALPAIGPQTERDRGKQMNILVLVSGNTKYGLIVDRVHDIEEVVVKPLSKHLNSVSAYAGATILGDGKVILILDAYGLAEESGCRFDSTQESVDRAMDAQGQNLNEGQSLLLFTVAPEERFAIPLALISRLEKFKTVEINHAGGKEVIQYRGRILPLIRLEDHLPISRSPESGEDVNIIVFNFEKNEVGIVVTEIVDVVEIAVNLDQSTFGHQGILGSSIVNDHTTLFLDIFNIVGGVFPTWFANKKTPLSAGDFAAEEYTILFAEDSQFFRTIVRSYLEAKNYTVLEAHDGQEAFEMLESAAKVDLVLTDVEMPRMNGFELAEAIRASEKWSHLPIMALTSLASKEDRERGLKAGVNEYCVKLDRTEVLDVIDKLIQESSAVAV